MRGFAAGFIVAAVLVLTIAWTRPPTVQTVQVVVERPVPYREVAPLPERALVLEVTATAYSSRVEETDDTPLITAAGTEVREGIVAVSRDLETRGLGFGSAVVITRIGGPGCGGEAKRLVGRVLRVEDRMHPRKRRQIDLWFPSAEAALAFGRCRVEVVAFAPG